MWSSRKWRDSEWEWVNSIQLLVPRGSFYGRSRARREPERKPSVAWGWTLGLPGRSRRWWWMRLPHHRHRLRTYCTVSLVFHFDDVDQNDLCGDQWPTRSIAGRCSGVWIDGFKRMLTVSAIHYSSCLPALRSGAWNFGHERDDNSLRCFAARGGRREVRFARVHTPHEDGVI